MATSRDAIEKIAVDMAYAPARRVRHPAFVLSPNVKDNAVKMGAFFYHFLDQPATAS